MFRTAYVGLSKEVLASRFEPVPPTAPRRCVAIFAPHLVTPIRNGSDLYIWRKWGALDFRQFSATLYAADAVYRMTQQGWTQERGRGRVPTLRSKQAACALALARGCDYLSARFNTPAYLDLVRDHGTERIDLAVYSYASTYAWLSHLLPGAPERLVETHNVEAKYYLDLGANAGRAFRVAASAAARRADAVLASIPRDVALVALGESDASLLRAMGHQRVLVGDMGYERYPPRAVFGAPDAVSLAFVGSLSVAMNVMAVRQFIRNGLPLLRQAMPCKVEVHVAGSSPSVDLISELRRSGVQVHADPGDCELRRLVQRCHATIVPFHSANGTKLKVALSASLGVPVLSYIDAPPALRDAAAVLTSRDMTEWAAFLAGLRHLHPQVCAARELQTRVRDRGWDQVVRDSIGTLVSTVHPPSEG